MACTPFLAPTSDWLRLILTFRSQLCSVHSFVWQNNKLFISAAYSPAFETWPFSCLNLRCCKRQTVNIVDVRWIQVRTQVDERGSLTAIEAQDVPFPIRRVFYMHDVTSGSTRGGHAHLDTDQFALAVHGAVRLLVSDGVEAREIFLNTPSAGVYLPRMTWTVLSDFSPGAVCLVLASTQYDRSRSIRTWREYLLARCLSSVPEFSTGPLLLQQFTGKQD